MFAWYFHCLSPLYILAFLAFIHLPHCNGVLDVFVFFVLSKHFSDMFSHLVPMTILLTNFISQINRYIMNQW